MSRRDVDISRVWSLGGPTGDDPIDFAEMFGNDNPVELDVGSGKGLFLLSEAERRPQVNFLGVEWSQKYARLSAERAVRNDLANVRVVTTDAQIFILKFPDACLSAVHIYFPDPWWKKRHRKRRVVNPRFISQVARVLVPGGGLYLVTDVEEYFRVMLEVMASAEPFEPARPREASAPSHDLDYLTHFERKYRKENRAIYRAAYRLAGADA